MTKDVKKAVQKKNKLYKKSIKTRDPVDVRAYKKFSNTLNFLKKNRKRKNIMTKL